MRVIRWFLGLIVVVALALAAVVLAARFGDGPMGPLPGGPLRAGELVADPQSDWGFAKDTQEIEMQLEAQTTSRITWIVVKDGAAYVPCSLDFPPFKSWYKKVAEDGRAVVRTGGRRYPVTLQKVEDEALVGELRAVAGAKYAAGPRPPEGRVWFFRLLPRTPAGTGM
jgi:hypothetical protein